MGKNDTSREFHYYIVYGRKKLSIKVSVAHPS